MYLMIADEADQDGSKEFMVFAGVFFPFENLQKISTKVQKIREKYGFTDEFDLKFSPISKPEGFELKDHTKIKDEVLKLAAAQGCMICCYVVPHAIAKGQSHANKLKFGVNTLLSKFDAFLREQNTAGGIALFDRSEDYKQRKYLKDAFNLGVLSEATKRRKKLSRVVHVDNTAIGHSHLTSVTDIVVGSFRFIINEPDKDKVGTLLLQSLEKLMWHKTSGGEINVRERGICIRPRDIKSSAIKADVDALVSRLEKWSS